MKAMTRVVAVVGLALALRLCTMGVARSPEQPQLRTFRGAVHVHSGASHDAAQTAETIAHDAHAAGLDFVVLTDHDQKNGEPRYLDGVLIVPETERSLARGHVLTLGGNAPAGDMRGADPWPALADSHAFLVGAHPDSLKNPLTDAQLAHVGGYELLSASSDFYAQTRTPAAFFIAAFPLRPLLAFSALYPDQARGDARFDRLSAERELALFCGTDDHGWSRRPERLTTYVTYVPVFFPEHDANADAGVLRDLLTRGAFACVLGIFGDASPLSVTLKSAAGIDSFGAHAALPATLTARWNGPLPEGHHYFVTRDGAPFFDTTDAGFALKLDQVGRYRLEVERTTPGFWLVPRHVRWIYGNPFWLAPGAA
jgi:hypothetical protein